MGLGIGCWDSASWAGTVDTIRLFTNNSNNDKVGLLDSDLMTIQYNTSWIYFVLFVFYSPVSFSLLVTFLTKQKFVTRTVRQDRRRCASYYLLLYYYIIILFISSYYYYNIMPSEVQPRDAAQHSSDPYLTKYC